jgi:hypothetical protein
VGKSSNRKRTLMRAERVGKRTKNGASSRAVAVSIGRIGVAHHEAAHAVIGSLLGLPVQYVEITVQAGGVTGLTSTPYPQWVDDWAASDGTGPLDDDQRAYLHANMVALLAGALADRQFRPYGLTPDDDQDPRSDVDQVSQILWRLVGGDDQEPVQRALDSLLEVTSALMEKHWPQVQVVAAELTQRRRLTGSEVAALLATPARVTWSLSSSPST